MSLQQRKNVHGRWIVVAALGLALASLAIAYPGVMSWDSRDQYEQALLGRYGDWHPPIMAILWRQLLSLAPGGAPLYLLNVTLYWAALGLIADAMRRKRHLGIGICCLLLGLLPIFWLQLADVMKDTAMTVACLCGFAFIFHRRVARARHIAVLSAIIVVILLAYAYLLRANAIFCVAPLIWYALLPARRLSWVTLFVGSSVAIALGILATGPINHRVLGARDENSKRSLFTFDRAGIAYFSKDPKVLGPGQGSLALVRDCYTPRLWDGLGRGRCAEIGTAPLNGSTWVKAIVGHPLAYAEHRLAHFNQALFLFTRPQAPQSGFTDSRFANLPRSRVETWSNYAVLLAFPPFVPAFTLLLSLFLTIAGIGKHDWSCDPIAEGSFVLALSSLLYGGAYLAIGVANMIRYFYYPSIAAYLSLALYLASRGTGPVRSLERVALGALLLLSIVIILARLDVPGMVW